MSAEELWNEFIQKYNINENKFEAWAFGENTKELTKLVLKGIKTATSSLYVLYENELLPKVDEYSILLDEYGNAKCIIKNKKVEIISFNKITEEHAFLEGESDRTLSTWRKIHQSFFTRCLEEKGMTFDEKMLVVCEQFNVVYKQ
ncbi:ASCH domain-containing protein [Eubacterium ventriosum]|uniref:ASCH domain-containing protein n=1 Tax=Eubacterium ventriosum TaxID=39496 RepID=A0A413RUR4_9FIRM|nr:ASCH domain-containing protein [Eubacterium ventriosum]RHA52080.1 ASCH domain-containing protein [Eubacterium ventriosum]